MVYRGSYGTGELNPQYLVPNPYSDGARGGPEAYFCLGQMGKPFTVQEMLINKVETKLRYVQTTECCSE